MQVGRTSTHTGKELLPLVLILQRLLTGVSRQVVFRQAFCHPESVTSFLLSSRLPRPLHCLAGAVEPWACQCLFWYNTSMKKCFEYILWRRRLCQKGCFCIHMSPFSIVSRAGIIFMWRCPLEAFFPEISTLPAEQKRLKPDQLHPRLWAVGH